MSSPCRGYLTLGVLLAGASCVASSCAGSKNGSAAAGKSTPRLLPLGEHDLGFVVHEGRRLIRGLGWMHPGRSAASARIAANDRARATVASLFERFRTELRARFAATPGAVTPSCIDGSAEQCWLWAEVCTLASATISDTWSDQDFLFAIAELDLEDLRVCVEKQNAMAPQVKEMVLQHYMAAHATLARPEINEGIRHDLEERWLRYLTEIEKGVRPAFAETPTTNSPLPATEPPTPPDEPPVEMPPAEPQDPDPQP